MSNILDMDDTYLYATCHLAAERFMDIARQQTEPEQMHRYAIAACCVEQYPDALEHMVRDKFLAAFDLAFPDDVRSGILADIEANHGAFGSDVRELLCGFLNSTAIRHVAADRGSVLQSMKNGSPTPNFKALAAACAEEQAGAGLGSAGRHVGELRMEAEQASKAAREARPHLDTPEAVRQALLSGKDLYNPETGEFWWLYNESGSIARATVRPDDPNLLEAIGKPDFDLYEDVVGGLNYAARIIDSPEHIAEAGSEAPDADEREAVFRQIAEEKDWIPATPDRVREALIGTVLNTQVLDEALRNPARDRQLQRLRREAGWRLPDMAESLGIPLRQYISYESGEQPMPSEVAWGIAERIAARQHAGKEPRAPYVSLKDAAKESRDASQALAGHDAPGDGTPGGR